MRHFSTHAELMSICVYSIGAISFRLPHSLSRPRSLSPRYPLNQRVRIFVVEITQTHIFFSSPFFLCAWLTFVLLYIYYDWIFPAIEVRHKANYRMCLV